jgi:hypothetical protein
MSDTGPRVIRYGVGCGGATASVVLAFLVSTGDQRLLLVLLVLVAGRVGQTLSYGYSKHIWMRSAGDQCVQSGPCSVLTDSSGNHQLGHCLQLVHR